MQPRLSPLPAPILQALITLSSDLHILLPLWAFGVLATQIALPPTLIVHQVFVYPIIIALEVGGGTLRAGSSVSWDTAAN